VTPEVINVNSLLVFYIVFVELNCGRNIRCMGVTAVVENTLPPVRKRATITKVEMSVQTICIIEKVIQRHSLRSRLFRACD